MSALDGALRKAILAAAADDRLERLAGRYGLQLGASRFVAGRPWTNASPCSDA